MKSYVIGLSCKVYFQSLSLLGYSIVINYGDYSIAISHLLCSRHACEWSGEGFHTKLLAELRFLKLLQLVWEVTTMIPVMLLHFNDSGPDAISCANIVLRS